ncbi:5013_t:CDS:2 [Funneliformis geosporum]|uniref:Peroxidase n=1 Tax=Funneliformis geosporum TaxID=1117311 RepID=A0A9W4SHF8_9GLOM|nr:10636_t:CDS:2 [Funneliformis geosporum]CAI2172032.1 5013_t:CDS:2 [Funneliformis geosporum]
MSSIRFVRAFSSRANAVKFVANATRPKAVKAVSNTTSLRTFAIPSLNRHYNTQKSPPQQPEQKSKSGSRRALIFLGAGLIGVGTGYYFYSTDNSSEVSPTTIAQETPDYQKIYNQIADILEENDWDDGSLGPIFVRLAWHASGTYDKETNTGGSNGATMRFAPESDHGANAGLKHARDKLESIKQKNPAITYSDLWSLAGVVAIQEMAGPIIPWIPGRKDADAATACSPDGRLPDASKASKSKLDLQGFKYSEIVALAGAHALGRCHPDRSGFQGPWTFSPITFTNGYFTELLKKKWVDKKWKGPKQFVDKETGELMMLPADMALIQDKNFKTWVETYSKDEALFFKDFAAAFHKLEELGVPRTGNEKVYNFKRTGEN